MCRTIDTGLTAFKEYLKSYYDIHRDKVINIYDNKWKLRFDKIIRYFVDSLIGE